MPDKKHSTFAPSSAARHLHCTPSLRLEEMFPDPLEDKTAAREGTDAHEMAEYKVRKWLGLPVEEPVISDEWDRGEMESCTDSYLAFIKNTASAMDPYPTVLPEQIVNFDNWVPGGFGTCDCMLISENILHIIDFKYGRVRVETTNNTQMKVYALGALQEYSFAYPQITTVRMSIYQPRINNIDTFEMSIDGLYNWAKILLVPRARMALNGEGELNMGEWCKYCKAKGACLKQQEAIGEAYEQMIKASVNDPKLLTVDEIADLLPKTEELVSWCKDLKTAAESLALAGNTINGYGFEPGNKKRQFEDEAEVLKRAKDLGIEDQITTVKSVSAIEKSLGKVKFVTTFGDLVTEKQGNQIFKRKK